MTKKQLFHHSFSMLPPAPSPQQVLDEAIRLHQRGNLQQAEQLYRMLLQAQPKHAYVLNLLGMLLSQKGERAEGEKLLHKAIKIDPDVADYHNNLGMTLLHQNKLPEAAAAFKKATVLNPRFINAWLSLGNVSLYLKDADAAIDSYRKVIEINPEYLPAYNNLGNIYREIRRFDEALHMFQRCLELKPDFHEIWYNIGMVYKAMEDGDQAIAAFEKAIALKPDYVKAHLKAGQVQRLLRNDLDAALRLFDRALEIDPRAVAALLLKVELYQGLGRFDEAEEELRKAIEIDESSVSAYLKLVEGKKLNDDDLNRMQMFLEDPRLQNKRLVDIHFSLGKVFDRRKEYEKAMYHFNKGNAVRPPYEYDRHEIERNFSILIKVFDEDYLARNSKYGLQSDLPVFIVGMPRSGTTLTEQIIASHPAVFGAGELEKISHMLVDILMRANAGDSVTAGIRPAGMRDLTEENFRNMADDYLSHIQAKAPDALRIVDKMPHNFLYVGLISILYPRARIIHCRRNPIDTCLSIYTQNFRAGHEYAYDLKELGFYYRQYLRLMAHWEKVLPGRLFHLYYEKMVADQESISRKLIEYLGLPWDDRCLQYTETERTVRTASVWQVRQKVYTTSKERWRHYEPWLGPLIEALGDAVSNYSNELQATQTK